MENLDLKVVQTAGKIECNFDELRKALQVQMSAYKNVVVDEENIPNYKSELATLRKFSKAIDDRRKEVEKAYCEPVEEFKEQVKTLLAEIDKPICLIDTQIKMFSEEKAQKKLEFCKNLYEEMVGEYKEFLPFDSIFNKKWLNVSYNVSDIKYDISEKITKVKNDLSVIKGLASDIEEEIIKIYMTNGNDLAKAIERNTQYLSDKARLEAKKADPVIDRINPLEGTKLNTFVEKVKTAKIIVSLEDLQKVKNCLDFADIKYQIIEE